MYKENICPRTLDLYADIRLRIDLKLHVMLHYMQRLASALGLATS